EAGVLGPARFDLHDGTVVVTDRRERVLEAASPREAPRVHARRLAEPPANGVEVVEHQVEDDAAALRVVEIPLAGRADREVSAHQRRDRGTAERSVIEQLLRALVLREVAHDVADREGDAGGVARAHHLLRLLARARDRLFAEHMLARPRGHRRVLGMEVRRRRDDDEVDVVCGADLLGGRDASAAFLRERGGLIEWEGGDGNDPYVVESERAAGVHRARESRAEYA